MREECLICKGLLIYNEIKKENAGICSDVKRWSIGDSNCVVGIRKPA